jgi:ketosteroid isomerase-like protein
MSEENVEICRRMSVAFRNGDWAAAFEPVHPDIEMDATRGPIGELARTYTGLDEVAAFWREWLEAWGPQSYDEELTDAGDQVVMWVTGHELQGRGSGIEVGMPPYGWVATLRNGKLVKGTMYMNKAEALEAAGLSDSDS